MFPDPIVEEVRKAGKQLAEEAHGDPGQFFANLRQAQEKYKDRLINRLADTFESELPHIERGKTHEIHVEQA